MNRKLQSGQQMKPSYGSSMIRNDITEISTLHEVARAGVGGGGGGAQGTRRLMRKKKKW